MARERRSHLPRFDPDERVGLPDHLTGEDVLRRLLNAEEVPIDEDDPSEDEGS